VFVLSGLSARVASSQPVVQFSEQRAIPLEPASIHQLLPGMKSLWSFTYILPRELQLFQVSKTLDIRALALALERTGSSSAEEWR